MTTPPHRLTRAARPLGVATALAVALVAAACIPPPPTSPPPTTTTTTTTTTTAPSTVETISDATLEWTISPEANNATFAPGQVNYWSAGVSDSTEATYVPTDGDITVLKKNASGTFVPIGSEPAVSWENRNRDGNGNLVTVFGPNKLGQKVRFADGVGTVDTATGEATISWQGTFTVNFYGQLVPFWFVDPTLVIDAQGDGQLTATMGGFASSLSDPDTRVPLPETPDVVVADLPDVYASGGAGVGFSSAATAFLGTAVTVPAGGTPQAALSPANQAFWGSWPQSFVDFQQDTGLGSFWYTSGGGVDPFKPTDPVSVSWTLDP